MRERTSRGGRREAPAAGAAGPSPQPVGGSVSAAGEELAAAQAAPCRGLRHSLSAAQSSHQRVSFQSWFLPPRDRSSLLQKSFPSRKTRGSFSAVLPPAVVSGAALTVLPETWISGYPQRMPQGKPLCRSIAVRAPSSAPPGTNCDSSGCSAPDPRSTAAGRAVRLQLYLLAIATFFFPGTVAGNNCCSIDTRKGFSEVWLSRKRPGVFYLSPNAVDKTHFFTWAAVRQREGPCGTAVPEERAQLPVAPSGH